MAVNKINDLYAYVNKLPGECENCHHNQDHEQSQLLKYTNRVQILSGVQRPEFQRITAQQTQLDLRLSWGPAPICSNIEQVGLTWAMSPLSLVFTVSLVMANESRGAFFWPIAFSYLCSDTESDCIEGRGLRSASGDRTSGYIHYKKWQKIPPLALLQKVISAPAFRNLGPHSPVI